VHITDGQLRAYLDGETCEGVSLETIEKHLLGCSLCRQRLQEINQRSLFIKQQFAALLHPAAEIPPVSKRASRLALANLKKQIQKKEPSIMSKLFDVKFRPAWAAVIVITLLVITLSFPTGRTWAGEFLGLFRAQQVRVIPIDASGMSQYNGDTTLGKEIGDMVSKSITVKKEPGKPRLVVDAQEASQLTGFAVRLPAQPSSQMYVQEGSAFDIVVDRPRVQALLNEIGRTDLVLPDSLDNAIISMDIPTGVAAAYGTCPDFVAEENETNDMSSDIKRQDYPDCLLLAEIPSPTVNTPPNLDVAKLAEIGLQFSGMQPDEARAFTESVDWTSSLVVPIPKQDATVEQVTVDGVEATLITRDAGYAPRYVLLWIKDSIIYNISGWGVDASRAIEIANSLK